MKTSTGPFLTLLAGLMLSTASHALEVGSAAPDFSLDGIKNVATTGKNIALSDYKGKVVYVDFWASWCGPCRRSFPKLEALHQQYRDQGFEVIAINLDEQQEDAHKFLQRYPVSFPIAWDPKGNVAEQYQLKGMPSAYILDRDGVVRHVVVGFDEKQDVALIESAITRLSEN